MVTSLAFYQYHSLRQVIEAASWRADATFVSFYLGDLGLSPALLDPTLCPLSGRGYFMITKLNYLAASQVFDFDTSVKIGSGTPLISLSLGLQDRGRHDSRSVE
jgi:hypothetical protein